MPTLQVVMTTIDPKKRSIGTYDAYEYTVHSHQYTTEDIPAARFSYELSPIQVLDRCISMPVYTLRLLFRQSGTASEREKWSPPLSQPLPPCCVQRIGAAASPRVAHLMPAPLCPWRAWCTEVDACFLVADLCVGEGEAILPLHHHAMRHCGEQSWPSVSF